MTIKTFIIAACLVFTLIASAHAEPGWQYATPMPNARYGHDAVVGKDGKIYVMGGMVYDHKKGMKYNWGEFSSLVFDPVANKWVVFEPVPGWILHRGEFNYYDHSQQRWIDVWKEKGATDRYKAHWPPNQKGKIFQIPPEKLRNTDYLRQGDGTAIALAKDGRIFWIGGMGKWMGPGENLVLPYDPVSNKWPEALRKEIDRTEGSYRLATEYLTDIPPMNQRRIDHEAVSLPDGRIFVLGGYHEILELQKDNQLGPTGETEVLDSVECYDPEKNTWEYKKPMLHKRFLFAAVVGRDNKIYVFGGGGKYNKKTRTRPVYNTTEVYDPGTDTWSYRSPMPKGLFTHAAALGADGRIYILGGSGGRENDPPLKDVFIYDPVADTWGKGPSLNLPRSTLAAVSTSDGKIYAIGGTDAGAYSSAKGLINAFLSQYKKLYTGKVQDTVEVLNTKKLRKK